MAAGQDAKTKGLGAIAACHAMTECFRLTSYVWTASDMLVLDMSYASASAA